MKIQVTYMGRSYDQAATVPAELTLADDADLDAALSSLAEHIELPLASLIAINGDHAGTVSAHSARTLADGDDLVVIAPVAGG